MSGGVGPCKDIALPKEEHEQEPEQPDRPAQVGSPPTARVPRGKTWFLSLRHVNALALAVVLAASGTVSPWDLAFVAFAALYMLFLSRVAFPARGPRPEPPAFDPNSRSLRRYVQLGALVGLYLPIAYILEGVHEGDKDGIRAAAPHLFLLAAQIFMEGIAFSGRFSSPIRAFVPIIYNSRRLSSILDWLWEEFTKTGEEPSGLSTRRRLYVGRGLAIANMAFWSFNLFGFLLPVYLPRVFRAHCSAPLEKDV